MVVRAGAVTERSDRTKDIRLCIAGVVPGSVCDEPIALLGRADVDSVDGIVADRACPSQSSITAKTMRPRLRTPVLGRPRTRNAG